MTVLVFGSANADLAFTVTPGGKGANQAVAAARDGAAVVFAGCVGRDGFADVATSALRDSGVDLTRLAVVDQPTGCAAICVDPAGRNQIAVAPGANFAARAVQVEDAALHPGVILLLQREVPAVEIAALVARAKARGARVVLNLAPPGDLPLETLRALDLLVVNEHEAAVLAARLGCAADAAGLRAALGVAPQGALGVAPQGALGVAPQGAPEPDVAVTLGEAGAEAATASGTLTSPAFPVTAVDTTGAGDCWCGVLCAGLDRGLDLAGAMRRASAAAAIACTRPGAAASMPTKDETDALAAR